MLKIVVSSLDFIAAYETAWGMSFGTLVGYETAPGLSFDTFASRRGLLFYDLLKIKAPGKWLT